MTPEKLNELERLEQAATPGDLRAAGGYLSHTLNRRIDYTVEHLDEIGKKPNGPYQAIPFARWEDAKLLAALRNSAAELIADSRKLRKLEEAAREMLNALDNVTSPDDWSTSGLREALADCAAGPVEGTCQS